MNAKDYIVFDSTVLKAYYLLREDLQYSSERLFRIAVNSFPLIEHNRTEFMLKPRYDILMIFNMHFLYELEKSLIHNGVHFKFLEHNNTPVGILIEPTTKDVKSTLLRDCLPLSKYAHYDKDLNEFKTKDLK
jgi:non-homologous end joining protein Ku